MTCKLGLAEDIVTFDLLNDVKVTQHGLSFRIIPGKWINYRFDNC